MREQINHRIRGCDPLLQGFVLTHGNIYRRRVRHAHHESTACNFVSVRTAHPTGARFYPRKYLSS